MASLESVRTNLADLFERHDSLGLLVDAFHLHAAQENLHQALGPMLQTRIVGIHLADLPVAVPLEQIIDNQRALPGTSSTVPVRKTLQELAQMGCDAPVMIETVQSTQELKIAGFKEAMEIVFNKSKSDGVNVYSQRDGDAGWVFLARDTESPYVDNRPLLAAGKPEVRRYKAIYVLGDDETGQPSDEITVTATP
ncbi:MAG: TIM barrel protein, partial [Candidatus Omnitrophota bacterium]